MIISTESRIHIDMKKVTTVAQLRAIIREEVKRTLNEHELIVIRRGNNLYLNDDEGNSDLLGSVDSFPQYDHLEDGQTSEYYGKSGSGGAANSYGYYGSPGRSRGSRSRW